MRLLRLALLGAALGLAAAPLCSGGEASRAVPPEADTSRVRLGSGPSASDAFVAWPSGSGRAPGVLVLHEWWGLDGQIREVARQLASQGYVAVVPDLYHGEVASDPEHARALASRLSLEDAFATVDAAARWLRAEPRTARARLGLVGFCMGGGLAERYALRTSGLSAVVMFYGQPETDPAKLAALGAPLQGHFGAEDSSIPLAKVEELRSALAKADKPGEIYVYPGAGHAFMHEGNDTYRPDAARQAWARLLAFLQDRLKSR